MSENRKHTNNPVIRFLTAFTHQLAEHVTREQTAAALVKWTRAQVHSDASYGRLLLGKVSVSCNCIRVVCANCIHQQHSLETQR